jgi:HD-GYP domain-containing protein (c-di-GMP phosphodiesterase class II)
VAQNINVAIFKTVLSAFETDGFTPQLQRLTVASVNLAINTIQKNPKLGDLLSRLNKNRDTYLSWHSTALGFLSCRLATMLGWQSEATFYKLSFASLLHDIVLSSDELAKIQTIEQLNASGLSDRDRAKVQRHPLEGSNLLQNLEEVPSEIAFIIEQHHERQDGSGFPRGIDHKEISSISALFIISHDIVTTMYDAPPENFQIRGFLTARDIDKTYTKGAFGQVFRSIIASSADL